MRSPRSCSRSPALRRAGNRIGLARRRRGGSYDKYCEPNRCLAGHRPGRRARGVPDLMVVPDPRNRLDRPGHVRAVLPGGQPRRGGHAGRVAFLFGGVAQLVAAGRVRHWRWLYILTGVVGVLAGILTFAWPSILLRSVHIVSALAGPKLPWWWTGLLLGIAELVPGHQGSGIGADRAAYRRADPGRSGAGRLAGVRQQCLLRCLRGRAANARVPRGEGAHLRGDRARPGACKAKSAWTPSWTPPRALSTAPRWSSCPTTRTTSRPCVSSGTGSRWIPAGSVGSSSSSRPARRHRTCSRACVGNWRRATRAGRCRSHHLDGGPDHAARHDGAAARRHRR
jgi:hypothetical protein